MKKIKKWAPIAAGLILLILIFTFGIIKNQSVHKLSNTKNNTARYVLVNEDLGGKFNNKDINLGKNFVTLINQDKKNNWDVASLGVAERGFEEGSYDVEIVLPQNFSKRLLNLKSTNPQQAQITYKVREGYNNKANQAVQKKVGNIISSFNQKIINMYFSSVLGNLSQAQRNVSGMVNGQEKTQNLLANNVQDPFSQLPGSFEQFVSMTDGLKSSNQSWEQQQNQFSKSTQEMLQSTGSSVNSSSQNLDEYVDLQKTISAINQKNASNLVESQFSNDTKQFSNFVNDQTNSLNSLNYTMLEFSLVKQKSNISDLMTKTYPQLLVESANISTNISNLRRQILQNYFGSESNDPTLDIDPDQAARDYAKNVIQNILTNSGASESEYLKSLSNINVDPNLPVAIDDLYSDGVINENQRDKFKDEFQIINYYNKYDLKKENKVVEIKSKTDNSSTSENFTETFSINNQDNAIIYLDSKDADLKIDNLQQIVTSFNKQLKNYHGVASIDGTSIRINFNNKDEVEKQNIVLKANPKLIWTYSTNDLQQQYRKLPFSWIYKTNETTDIQGTRYLSSYVNDVNLSQDKLLEELNDVAFASGRIVTLFGSPNVKNTTLGTEEFADSLVGKNQSIASLAKKDSIFNSFDSLSDDEIDSIANYLGSSGLAELNKVKDITVNLNDLNGQLNGSDPSSLFLVLTKMQKENENSFTDLQGIIKWKSDALAVMNKANDDWQNNASKVKVTNKQYDSNDDNTSIYYEEDSGNSLIKEFNQINQSTQEQVKSTSESAAKIESLSSQFDALVNETKGIHGDMTGVLDNTKALVSSNSSQVSDNKNYATGFGTVFNNAYKGGADNQNVFSFLSNPLTRKGETYNETKVVSVLPYMTVILLTIIASVITLSYLQKSSEETLKKLFINLIGSSTIFGLIVGLITASSNEVMSGTTWTIYTIITIVILTLVIYLLSKLIPKIAPYILGVLAGFYLMLTPILGLTVEKSSILHLLYTLSPLQLLENGFTEIINGESFVTTLLVSILTLIILVGLSWVYVVKSNNSEDTANVI